MTRINSNIPPAKLIDQHLLAEYREMVRIPSAVKKLYETGKFIPKLPNTFRLGTGHVLYFYDKLQFLHKRYLSIKDELNNRSIINNMSDEMFFGIPCQYYNDIGDNDLVEANHLIVERITERINGMKGMPRYKGKSISKEQAIQLLK